MKKYRFCPICKSNLSRVFESGNARLVCPNCGWRYYSNPLPSVAAFVCNANDEILLIKRGVDPGKGKWALPSGFIEQKELPQDAALRELKEETNVTGKIDRLIGVYREPTKIYGSVLLIGYEITPIGGRPRPGSDTAEAKFFSIKKIPKIPFKSHQAIIKDGLKKEGSEAIEVLKSKITEATITHTKLFYEGSIGIDGKIMAATGIIPGEKVQVLNYNNGERLETYTIKERPNSGRIVLYGPAARKGRIGDRICILSYAIVDIKSARRLKTKFALLDERNRIK